MKRTRTDYHPDILTLKRGDVLVDGRVFLKRDDRYKQGIRTASNLAAYEEIVKKDKKINRDYRENNKEKVEQINRDYYEKNKEKERKRSRDYRENNKEKVKKGRRDHYEKNKGKVKKRSRDYKKNNKAKVNANNARRDSKKRELTPPDADFAQIENFYTLSSILQVQFGVKMAVDHIWPQDYGGPHHQDNLAVVISTANSRKGNRRDLILFDYFPVYKHLLLDYQS